MSSYIEICVDDTPKPRVGSTSLSPNTINPAVRVALPVPCLGLEEVLESLVKPALLASGFSASSVERIFIHNDELKEDI